MLHCQGHLYRSSCRWTFSGFFREVNKGSLVVSCGDFRYRSDRDQVLISDRDQVLISDRDPDEIDGKTSTVGKDNILKNLGTEFPSPSLEFTKARV